MLNSISEREKYFEELDKNSEIKHHVLYIEPDYDALLWENNTVICGSEYYGFGFDFQGSDNESDVYEVELEYDQEADNWLNQFYESCLIPTATGKIELEELVHLFDWKEFHLKGLQIALRMQTNYLIIASFGIQRLLKIYLVLYQKQF